jgi:hypothetical protein
LLPGLVGAYPQMRWKKGNRTLASETVIKVIGAAQPTTCRMCDNVQASGACKSSIDNCSCGRRTSDNQPTMLFVVILSEKLPPKAIVTAFQDFKYFAKPGFTCSLDLLDFFCLLLCEIPRLINK